MNFDNYAGLQLAIADWLNRNDLVTQIPLFIRLAEVEIARVLRRTSVRATITISEEAYTLGDVIAELRSMRLVTSTPWADTPVAVGSPEWLWDMKANFSGAGRPQFASVIAGKIVVAPVPDSAYSAEIVYFSALVPLSAQAPTNIVLQEAPDLYLYGSLVASAPYLKADERIPTWENLFNKALLQLEGVREREETNASLRPIILPRVFG